MTDAAPGEDNKSTRRGLLSGSPLCVDRETWSGASGSHWLVWLPEVFRVGQTARLLCKSLRKASGFTALWRGCRRQHAGLLCKSFRKASASGAKHWDLQHFFGDASGIMPVCFGKDGMGAPDRTGCAVIRPSGLASLPDCFFLDRFAMGGRWGALPHTPA